MALSFNLDSLVQMPLGCGEQNMIHFAPSVYVLQYLEKTNLDNEEIKSRAMSVMMDGKQPKEVTHECINVIIIVLLLTIMIVTSEITYTCSFHL